MELTDNDRQRIEQEANEIFYATGHNRERIGFQAGAEYEHKYQREQQETLKNQVEYWRNCKVGSDEVCEAVIKKLEAERTALTKENERLREERKELMKTFRRLLEHCTKTNNFNQFDGILGEIRYVLSKFPEVPN